MGYNKEQKHQIIRRLYSNNNSITRVLNEYHQVFPRERIPSANTIRYIVKQFNETKSLKLKKRTIPRNEQGDLNILLSFEGKIFTKLFTPHNTTIAIFSF